MKNILVYGGGYVGFTLSVLLSKIYNVTLIDIDKEKISIIKKNKSPIKDLELEQELVINNHNIDALSSIDNFNKFDIAILALPTSYDENTNYFNTNALDEVIECIYRSNKKLPILIKSTIPIGYTKSIKKKFENIKIYFSPEFLREGRAFIDNKNPSRFILTNGGDKNLEKRIVKLFLSIADNRPKVLFMEDQEAEAVKLFANTYLAMRVSFFNELDTYAHCNGLDSKNIIDGISSDERIGNYYNNPSFGYGGYCLPKDTKQLLSNFKSIPQALIEATIKSNEIRKEYIANHIMSHKPKVVGIYRLIMKNNSDNFRKSAIFEIIKILIHNNIDVVIYEPLAESLDDFKLISLDELKKNCDLIVANRVDENIEEIKNKIITRDIFREN